MFFNFFKQRIFSKKLKTYLIISFLVTNTVITLALSAIYYMYASKMLITQSEDAILRSLRQLEYNVDQLLDNVSNISRQILVSAYFSKEMDIDSLTSSQNVRTVNEIYNYFNTILSNYSFIDSIFYYGDNGVILGTNTFSHYYANDTKKQNFFYSTKLYKDISGTKNIVLDGIYTSSDFFGKDTGSTQVPYITMARRVKTMGHTKGFILLNLKESSIRSLYHNDSINTEGESFLLDMEGNIISAGDKTMIPLKSTIIPNKDSNSVEFYIAGQDNEKINRENQIIEYSFKRYNLSIIYEIPYKVLFRDIMNLKNVIMVLFIISMAVSFAISIFWIYKLTKPLENLLQAMHNMGEGNIGLKLNENVRSELGLLGKQFNRMSGNIMELMEENKKIQDERHRLEMKNLQNQINPHFLYNTLNTIKWMSIVSKADNVAACITSLGNMLRPLYSSKEDNWTIQDEVNYLSSYIDIMNYRTADSLEFTWSLPQDILATNIPKFILQPIVENSVIHSNPNYDIRNVISVNGYREEGYLYLTVSDIGIGIPPEKLTQLKEQLKAADLTEMKPEKDDGASSTSIGLLNTHNRIRLQYGNDCGININSHEKGITVTIKLKPEIIPGNL